MGYGRCLGILASSKYLYSTRKNLRVPTPGGGEDFRVRRGVWRRTLAALQGVQEGNELLFLCGCQFLEFMSCVTRLSTMAENGVFHGQ